MRPAISGRRAWLVGCALMTIAVLDRLRCVTDRGAADCREAIRVSHLEPAERDAIAERHDDRQHRRNRSP